jgi:acetyl-CoA C-acetyltransferase
MTATKTYILGGAQSDFTRDTFSEGINVFDLFKETLAQAFADTNISPEDVDACHVGNASGDILTKYSQMGGFFSMAEEALAELPSGRHEGACASSSLAVVAGHTEVQAGFYDLVCVAGVEVMNCDATDLGELKEADQAIGTHAWPNERGDGWVWPKLFGEFLDDYRERYNVPYKYLAEIARKNLTNAKSNPNARAKGYPFVDECFTENDEHNPVAMNGFRMHDICRTADGAAFIFLASETFAKGYAQKNGLKLENMPYIKGFAHSVMPTELAEKKRLNEKEGGDYYMPHLARAVQKVIKSAGFDNIRDLDMMELHDCFTITEYMLLDHCGFEVPGEVWKIIEDGTTARDGSFPVNPSGGLIGCGHPVGCTGVRMTLDAYKQVAGKAGDYQVDGVKNAMTLNVGGTMTTLVSFIVGRD